MPGSSYARDSQGHSVDRPAGSHAHILLKPSWQHKVVRPLLFSLPPAREQKEAYSLIFYLWPESWGWGGYRQAKYTGEW